MSTNTLNKGDLVMTEHGLAWYVSSIDDVRINRVLKRDWGHVIDDPAMGGHRYSKQATKATRQQVEEWANENGWEENNYKEWWNDNNPYYIQYGGAVVLDDALYPEHFDTAPQMQAEAILLARMLNATKP